MFINHLRPTLQLNTAFLCLLAHCFGFMTYFLQCFVSYSCSLHAAGRRPLHPVIYLHIYSILRIYCDLCTILLFLHYSSFILEDFVSIFILVIVFVQTYLALNLIQIYCKKFVLVFLMH